MKKQSNTPTEYVVRCMTKDGGIYSLDMDGTETRQDILDIIISVEEFYIDRVVQFNLKDGSSQDITGPLAIEAYDWLLGNLDSVDDFSVYRNSMPGLHDLVDHYIYMNSRAA